MAWKNKYSDTEKVVKIVSFLLANPLTKTELMKKFYPNDKDLDNLYDTFEKDILIVPLNERYISKCNGGKDKRIKCRYEVNWNKVFSDLNVDTKITTHIIANREEYFESCSPRDSVIATINFSLYKIYLRLFHKCIGKDTDFSNKNKTLAKNVVLSVYGIVNAINPTEKINLKFNRNKHRKKPKEEEFDKFWMLFLYFFEISEIRKGYSFLAYGLRGIVPNWEVNIVSKKKALELIDIPISVEHINILNKSITFFK